MLTMPLAHAGRPPAPHDAWAAWLGDPALLAVLVAAAWLYARGRSRSRRPRPRARDARFAAGLLTVAIASQTPLDAAAHALASAHMVQHMLLILVAAPLLAASGAGTVLLAGLPRAARRSLGGARRGLGGRLAALRVLTRPWVAWLLHVGVLWLWHAAALYDAALRQSWLHAVEHATFLGTALLFWLAILPLRAESPARAGQRPLLVFTMGMQSVFLAVLLTFATAPWYAGYRASTVAWGLDPLADQQLAGAIMWVPAGFLFAALGIASTVSWLRAVDRAPT